MFKCIPKALETLNKKGSLRKKRRGDKATTTVHTNTDALTTTKAGRQQIDSYLYKCRLNGYLNAPTPESLPLSARQRSPRLSLPGFYSAGRRRIMKSLFNI